MAVHSEGPTTDRRRRVPSAIPRRFGAWPGRVTYGQGWSDVGTDMAVHSLRFVASMARGTDSGQCVLMGNVRACLSPLYNSGLQAVLLQSVLSSFGSCWQLVVLPYKRYASLLPHSEALYCCCSLAAQLRRCMVSFRCVYPHCAARIEYCF